MTSERNTGTFDNVSGSDTVENPSVGDTLTAVEVTRSAEVTGVAYTAENPSRATLVVRDSDGDNPEDRLTIGVDTGNTTEIVEGTVDDPVTSVGAGREVAVVSEEGTSGAEVASVTLEERNL